MAIIRGTTPTLRFTLPFETKEISDAWVTLSQRGKTIINKELNDCECDTMTLTVTLTQAETLQLQCRCGTEIQVRVKTLAGNAIASNIITFDTARISVS